MAKKKSTKTTQKTETPETPEQQTPPDNTEYIDAFDKLMDESLDAQFEDEGSESEDQEEKQEEAKTPPEDQAVKEQQLESSVTDEEGPESTPTLEELQAQIAEQTKQIKGFKKSASAERKKRQAEQEKSTAIIDTLSKLANQREEAKRAAEESQQPQEPEIPEYLEVEFDDEGKPRIPLSKIVELQKRAVDPEIDNIAKRVSTVENITAHTNTVNQQQQAIEARINRVVTQNKSYQPAVGALQTAWQWLDVACDENREEMGPSENIKTLDQLVDICDTVGINADFEKNFGIDVDTLVRSYGSDYNMRKTLKGLSAKLQENAARKDATQQQEVDRGNGQDQQQSTPTPQTDGIDKSLKSLANKQQNLSNLRNAKGETPETLEDLEKKLADTIFDFSPETDAQWQKVSRLIKQEEKKSFPGI